ncbi:MAG: hypothetical protein ALECFALPRED_011121, partial [Alectoria fallacina]
MSPSKPDMMLVSSNPTSGSGAFPREMRDKTFSFRNDGDYYVNVSPKAEFTDSPKTLHERAPISHVARTACEELWATIKFRSEWRSDSELIADSRTPLYLNVYDGLGWSKISLGTSSNLMDCVREIKLSMDPNIQDPFYPEGRDKESLSRLVRELSQLPRLRR